MADSGPASQGSAPTAPATIARKRWKLGKVMCAYCGVNTATTRDHPIPENLYPVELRAQLQMLVVPACADCNGAKSKVDNALRDFLVADIDSSRHAITQQLLADKMIRAITENHVRLLDGFYEGTSVPAFARQGEFAEMAYAIPADFKPVFEAVDWLTRGLHWSAFGSSVDSASTNVSLVDRSMCMDTVVQMAVMGGQVRSNRVSRLRLAGFSPLRA